VAEIFNRIVDAHSIHQLAGIHGLSGSQMALNSRKERICSGPNISITHRVSGPGF
jgi:hypothetical protein